MQPQSMNPNPAQPAGTPVPVRRAAPADGAAAPVASAPEPTFDNGPSVVGGKGNRKTGWILAIILLLLIAAGGVGFGVWAYMDSETQKQALSNQINSLQQANSELATKLENSENTTIVNVDVDGEEVDTADYIYVGEWGIKIRKPDDWRNLISEYSFSNDYPQAVDTFTIKEISDSNVANIIIGDRGDSSCDSLAVAPDACFEIGGNYFVVTIGDGVSDALKAYFTSQDNYSKI